MGAWYALLHEPAPLADDLSESLSTSLGTLTAPPLATVAAVMLGPAALPALTTYAQAAAANAHLGADGFIAAAMEHLGTSGLVTPTEQDREHLQGMLAVAVAIRG